jgi:hypothetical protein
MKCGGAPKIDDVIGGVQHNTINLRHAHSPRRRAIFLKILLPPHPARQQNYLKSSVIEVLFLFFFTSYIITDLLVPYHR